MTQLNGKIAIVTGGGSGLGRAMTLRFARDGARVIAADLNEDGAQETARLATEQGASADRVVARKLDVTDERACAALVDATLAEHGKLDVMVANAGIGTFGPIASNTMSTIPTTATYTPASNRSALLSFSAPANGTCMVTFATSRTA